MLCFEFYRDRRTATSEYHWLTEHCMIIYWYIYIAGFSLSGLHRLFIASAYTDALNILSHFLERRLLEGTG